MLQNVLDKSKMIQKVLECSWKFKKKFCNICRKRLDDQYAFRCESKFHMKKKIIQLFKLNLTKRIFWLVCEYYIHTDCQVLAVNDCCETATYVPSRSLSSVTHHHHWREGNFYLCCFLFKWLFILFLIIFINLLHLIWKN